MMKNKKYNNWRKILLNGLIFNFIFVFVYAPVANVVSYLGPNFESISKLADNIAPDIKRAEAASGDIIIFWDGDNGATPGGWTLLSGSGGVFENRFPLASASAGINGGGTTHTPTNGTVTVSNSNNVVQTRSGTTSGYAAATHTHDVPTVSGITAGTNRPKWGSLAMISQNGATTAPYNSIMMFGSAGPTGNWTAYSDIDDRLIIASASNQAQTTGGSDTHTHSATIGTIPGTGITATTGRNAGSGSTSTHTHTVNGGSAVSNTATRNIPPHTAVKLGRCNNVGGCTILVGSYAMFDATPPSGWTTQSNAGQDFSNAFIEASTSYSAVSSNGGAKGHTDSSIVQESDGRNGAGALGQSGQTGVADTHTHTATVPFNVVTDSRPLFRTVIVAKKDQPMTHIIGNVFTNETGTVDGTQRSIYVSVNGAAPIKASSSATTGAYDLNLGTALSGGEIITLWINNFNGSQPKGSFVFDYNSFHCDHGEGGDCYGRNIYEDRVSLGTQANAGSLTNSSLANCDNDTGAGCADTDIGFTSNGGVLTLTYSTNELYVSKSFEFIPGGNVNAQKLDIEGTYTGATETITLSGTGTSTTCTSDSQTPLCIGSSGVFNQSSTTVVYSGTSATIYPTTYKHLTLGGTGAYTLPASSNITMVGDLSITSGATVASSSEGHFIFRRGSSQTVTDNTATKQNLGELIIRASTSATTLTLGSDIRIASATIETSQVLNGGTAKTLTINGSGTPFTVVGTFTPSTGTVVYSSGASPTIANTTYNNLTISGTISSGTQTATVGGTLSVTGTFTPSAGTITMNNGSVISNAGTLTFYNLTIASGATVTANTSFSFTGTLANSSTATLSPSSGTITSTGGTISNSGTLLSFNNLTIGTGTTTANTSYTVKTTLAINGTLSPSSGTITLSGTGTPLSISGTFSPSGTNTVNYTGNGATVTCTGAPYVNLELKSSSTIAQVMCTGSSQTLSVSGALTIGDGTNAGATGATNNPTINASTLTLNTGGSYGFTTGTGTITLSGTGTPLTITQGTFTVTDSNKIIYTGDGATIRCNNITYYNLDLKPGSTTPQTICTGGSQTLTLANSLVIGDGGNAGASGVSNNPNYTIPGTLTVATGSVFNTGTGTITLSGTGTPLAVSGTFAPTNGSTVQYTGSTATVTATKFKNLTLGGTGTYTTPSSGNADILGNLVVTSGATVASGSSTLFFRAGGSQSVTDNNATKQNLGEIAVMASTGGNTTLTLGGSVRIASATIDPSQMLGVNGSNTLTITGVGDVLKASGSYGTFTPSTGTVVFRGNGAFNIPTLDYYDLKIQPSADSVTATFLAGTASISNTFTVGNGTNTGIIVTALTNDTGLDMASVSISANTTLVADNTKEFTLSRHFINNGSFTHSSGTVTFEGPNTSSISGATTFNNFTSTAAGKKIKFKAGTTFTFANNFTITGASGNTIKIESTASGSQWLALFSNPQSGVTYATITDSGCDGVSQDITLDGSSVNGGNNGSCWVFSSTYTQSNYQWFYNANNIVPGTSMAAINTSASGATTQPYRLRINLTVGTQNISAGKQAFKLKYATDLGGPWTDVGATNSFDTWKFNNNGGVTNGTTLSSSLLSSDVLQTYQEGNPSPVNPNGANITQTMEYDFALDPKRAYSGTTYYFRMFRSNDNPLDAFTNNPTIAMVSPDVSRAGSGGSNPSPGGASGEGTPQTGGGQNPVGDPSVGGGSGGGTPVSGDGDDGGGGPSPIFFWSLFRW